MEQGQIVSWHVYVLSEPDGPPCYVGCTNCPKRRLQEHYGSPAGCFSTFDWITSLRSQAIYPEMTVVLVTTNRTYAEVIERALIAQLSLYVPLLNRSDGKGPRPGWHHTEEARRAIGASCSWRGGTRSPESRRRMSEAQSRSWTLERYARYNETIRNRRAQANLEKEGGNE